MPDHPLLELQRIDSVADALAAEREGLAQRAALERVRSRTRELERRALAAQGVAARCLGDEQRIEGEVAELSSRAGQVEADLYSGRIAVVSELEGLQAKLDSLRAQKAELEDAELRVMEEREGAERELARTREEIAAAEAEAEALRGALADAEAALDERLAAVLEARREAAAAVAEAPLRVYGRLRASSSLGGLVTARLSGASCGECRISVPVVHATRVRRNLAGDVVCCESCRRILLP